MGRLIDCNDVYNAIQITTDNFGVAKSIVENTMLTMLSKIDTAEAIPKDQYENRLKADMVAMLIDIQLEIEEHTMTSGVTNQDTWNECIACCSRVIQQKIDALKADGRTEEC
jgi:hypothetical protein